MFQIGIRILLAWCYLNILPGIVSLVHIAIGRHAPAFQYLFRADEISNLDPRVLATTNGIAIVANMLIIVFLGLKIFVVQKSLQNKEKWAFKVLIFLTILVQSAAYWSDVQFGSKNVLIIHASTVWLIVAYSMIGYNLRESEEVKFGKY